MKINQKGYRLLIALGLMLAAAVSAMTSSASTIALVPQGTTWKYLDNGTDQGTAWKEAGFDDSSWKSGAAQLGYGDGDEQTIVSYGPDANNKYVTTYFRHTFQVNDVTAIVELNLQVLRDDGAVVYLNGTQVASYSMPSTFGYRTYATTASEYPWDATLSIPASLLVPGANVLAVEVHQCNATSSDLTLDLILTAEQLLPGTAPNVPVLVAPVDGASGVSIPPLLQTAVTDPDGDLLTVKFYGRKNVAAEPFTLAVLPDTQKYVATTAYAPIFTQQTQWIVDNRAALNIVAVTHEGDIVDTYNSIDQWVRANTSLTVLENSGLPFGLSPGNHDQPTTFYNQYFPPTRFSSKPWYGGNYPADMNDNNYILFSAGGVDFILVQLDFWPKSDAISWANSVLKAFPDRKAIITTHGFLGLDGSRNVHVMGSTEYIWTDLVIPNPNVWFVLCGHVHGEARRTDFANGHPVHQILADYQSDPNGGNGWLRIMQFVPAENTVYVRTYSPYLNQFQTDANSEFTLEFPMDGFELLGVQSGVLSGATVAHTWSDAPINTYYEWVVTATDPTGRTTQGPVWTFSTAASDNTAPVLSQVIASQISDQSAVISWSTDEPATSLVQYRVNGTKDFLSASDTALKTSHSVLLTGLTPATTYEFAVGSADAAGNSAASGAYSFTTKAPNVAPVADSQTVWVIEDTEAAVTLSASDANGDALTFRITSYPVHGVLSGTAPNLLYTPAANYFGSDSFGFVASDGLADSTATLVSIEISPVPDSPIARDDSASTFQGVAVSIPVSANDGDPDGEPLTIVSVTQPGSGTVTVLESELVYTPDAAFLGIDSFDYTIMAGQRTATATVTVTVTQNILFSDSFESGNFTAGGWIVSGPTAIDPSAAYQGSFGAVLKKTSSLTKQLYAVGPGTLQLSYVRSGAGLDSGEVGTVEMSSDGLNWTAIETVVNEPWSVEAVAIVLEGTDLHLRFGLNGNDGNDVFRVDEVTVIGGTSINPGNELPTAVSQSVVVPEDGSVAVTLTGTDPENAPLTFTIVSGPQFGTITGIAPDVTYVPNADYNGPDSFNFTVSDGVGTSQPAVVSITVQPQAGGTIMHVSSILVLSQDAGKGSKRGYAEVILVDADGKPVSGATIQGAFSGDITETVSANTGADGKAAFQTTTTVAGRAPRLRFQVTDAILAGWMYDPTANVETWDQNY